ncbi:MAG: diacylglycerol kinase [Beijerinckiaceae bacterium]
MERIVKAFWNSLAGFRDAARTEAAVRQEIFLLLVGIPLSWFVAKGVWQQVVLIASILLVIAVEMLNTCVEKLCDHVTPERHDDIRVVKDMGSGAVFAALAIMLLVWTVALAERLGAF